MRSDHARTNYQTDAFSRMVCYQNIGNKNINPENRKCCYNVIKHCPKRPRCTLLMNGGLVGFTMYRHNILYLVFKKKMWSWNMVKWLLFWVYTVFPLLVASYDAAAIAFVLSPMATGESSGCRCPFLSPGNTRGKPEGRRSMRQILVYNIITCNVSMIHVKSE